MSFPAEDAEHQDADGTIRACLDLDAPRSFFLFAGAGSGKTRSLVGALEDLLEREGERLQRNRQSVAVITYTNAAAEEIRERMAFDPRIEVSTLHAFAGRLIEGFHDDIRDWLVRRTETKLTETNKKNANGRSGSNAAKTRENDIRRMEKRLTALPNVKRFAYNPSLAMETDKHGALSHADVIAMASEFIEKRAGLRAQLVTRHPIVLIDESQDTMQQLLQALLHLEADPPAPFALGLFGDTMQRIYFGGKKDLATTIPDGWARPAKEVNQRCPKRIVALINAIRAEDDGQVQIARPDALEGHVRLFLAVPSPNPTALENEARTHMAEATGDANWNTAEGVKLLALEHRIAAQRQGYLAFFDPLHDCEDTKGHVGGGTGPEMTFLRSDLLPLLEAIYRQDRFAVMAHLRPRSPYLTADRLEADQSAALRGAQKVVEDVESLYRSGACLSDLIGCISGAGLMRVPELLLSNLASTGAGVAWAEALRADPNDLAAYDRYVDSRGYFDTHQGIKGLEFPRVLAVLSDAEARGRMFKYDKFLGGDGTDDSLTMIRNLFYVICSRARESLALVLHSSDPDAAKSSVVGRGFFTDGEVIQLN